MLQAYFSFDDSRARMDPKNPIPPCYYLNSDVDHANAPKKRYRILELGAGTGYVGIWLANKLRKPCEVHITDLEQVLPLIRDNVRTHYENKPDQADIYIEPLHWGNKEHGRALLQEGEFDLVVISDCVYFPELFPLLIETLVQICSPKTQVVIGYKCRSLEKEAGFWQDYFGRYFDYTPVRKLDIKAGSDSESEIGSLLGEEEQIFVFTGQRKKNGEVTAADDTFTTLLFCSMSFWTTGIYGFSFYLLQ